jgi:hypothetical protein
VQDFFNKKVNEIESKQRKYGGYYLERTDYSDLRTINKINFQIVHQEDILYELNGTSYDVNIK